MEKNGSALLTDLYQLNMMAAYLEHGLTETAVFELFVRKLSSRRGFLMTAGLEHALQFLEGASFTTEDIDQIRGLGQFSESFEPSQPDSQASFSVSCSDQRTLPVFMSRAMMESVVLYAGSL